MTYSQKIERLGECKTLDELCDFLDEINGGVDTHPYNHGTGLRSQVEDNKCCMIFVMIYKNGESRDGNPLEFSIEKVLVDPWGNVNSDHAKAWWVFQRSANMFNPTEGVDDPVEITYEKYHERGERGLEYIEDAHIENSIFAAHLATDKKYKQSSC